MAYVRFDDYSTLRNAKSYLEAQYDYNINGANYAWSVFNEYTINANIEQLNKIKVGLGTKFINDCCKLGANIEY